SPSPVEGEGKKTSVQVPNIVRTPDRSLASRGRDQRGTPGAYIRRGGGRFPPTTEGSIQPDDIEQFVTLETGEGQFCVKQVPFGIEYLQVGIEPPKKTLIGEPGAVPEGPNQELLLNTLFPAFAIADQSVCHFAERRLDGLFILRQEPQVTGLRGFVERTDAA